MRRRNSQEDQWELRPGIAIRGESRMDGESGLMNSFLVFSRNIAIRRP